MFAVDQVSLVTPKLEAHIYQERLRYTVIYDIIEEYIQHNLTATNIANNRDFRIIIGGSMGVNLLLGRERTYRDFQYVLYTENSLIHANDLTNEIAKCITDLPDDSNIKHIIVKLKSSIPDIKYEIYVDNRPLITIFTLRSDPVKTYNLLEPVEVKSFDGKRKLLVLSPETHLLDIYRVLSSPADVELWEEYLTDEERLFELLKGRLAVLGGVDKAPEITQEERTRVENALLEHYIVGNDSVVLLGEHAFKFISAYDSKYSFGNIQMSSNVINIISKHTGDELLNSIKKVVQKALGRDIPVVAQTRSTNVMQDFRLTRTTIKMGAENEQKEIMYVYNSAFFDLIPYNTLKQSKSGKLLQIANPFVLIRFLLIDLWMIRWVREMGKINEFFAKKRTHNILSLIVGLRHAMVGTSENKLTIPQKRKQLAIEDDLFANKDEPLNVFQRKRYIGIYVDELVTIRMKQQHLDKRYVDYYPQGYFVKNKQYRTLGKGYH
jgi:hypothetical protein